MFRSACRVGIAGASEVRLVADRPVQAFFRD